MQDPKKVSKVPINSEIIKRNTLNFIQKINNTNFVVQSARYCCTPTTKNNKT